MAKQGGDETRSGYVRYVHGIQPNIPAHITCKHGLYQRFSTFFICVPPAFPYTFLRTPDNK